MNTGEEVSVWFKAEYAYDDESFTGSDGELFINDKKASWDPAGNHWVLTVVSDSSTKLSYSVSDITDNQYGLSSFSQEVSKVEVEWKNPGIPGYPVGSIIVSLVLIIIIYSRKNH